MTINTGLVQNIITGPYAITFVVNNKAEVFPRNIELMVARSGLDEPIILVADEVELGDEIVGIFNEQ